MCCKAPQEQITLAWFKGAVFTKEAGKGTLLHTFPFHCQQRKTTDPQGEGQERGAPTQTPICPISSAQQTQGSHNGQRRIEHACHCSPTGHQLLKHTWWFFSADHWLLSLPSLVGKNSPVLPSTPVPNPWTVKPWVRYRYGFYRAFEGSGIEHRSRQEAHAL